MSTDATAQAMDAAETEARTVLQFPSNRVTGPLAGRDRRWAEDRLALIAADREQLTLHKPHDCTDLTPPLAPTGIFCFAHPSLVPWPCPDVATITRRWNGDNT